MISPVVKLHGGAKDKENRCGTCRYWKQYPTDGGLSYCERIVPESDGEEDLACVEGDIPRGDSSLRTRAEFGCVLWSKRDD